MTFVEDRFRTGFLFFSADIDTATQELIEDQAIRFEVIRFTAGAGEREADARADDATQFVRDFIKETFFEPSVDPKEAIEHGSLFPIGGAKGAMLALAFELVSAALTGAAIGPEADSFFAEQGNKPRIGQAFLAIDPGALAGMPKYFERVETVVRAMLADEGVRLPGSKRFASEKRLRAEGIEVPDELLAKIDKLCTT